MWVLSPFPWWFFFIEVVVFNLYQMEKKNQLKMESKALDMEFNILYNTCFHHLQIEVSAKYQAL